MIKQQQIQTHDCFSACLASLLHLNVEDVPNFYATHNKKKPLSMYEDANRWLKSRFNLKLHFLTRNKLFLVKDTYYIGHVIYTYNYRLHGHVCIYKNKKLVHDPASHWKHPINVDFDYVHWGMSLINSESKTVCKNKNVREMLKKIGSL